MTTTRDTRQFAPGRARMPSATLLAALLIAGGLTAPRAALAADPSPATAPPHKPGFNLDTGMNQIDRMLDKAQATPDQRTKIKAILLDAFMSMGALAPQLKATVSSLGATLMAPHIDRAALEAARVSSVADFDGFTKVLFRAIGDAAEVLTPEQRARLAKSGAKAP